MDDNWGYPHFRKPPFVLYQWIGGTILQETMVSPLTCKISCTISLNLMHWLNKGHNCFCPSNFQTHEKVVWSLKFGWIDEWTSWWIDEMMRWMWWIWRNPPRCWWQHAFRFMRPCWRKHVHWVGCPFREPTIDAAGLSRFASPRCGEILWALLAKGWQICIAGSLIAHPEASDAIPVTQMDCGLRWLVCNLQLSIDLFWQGAFPRKSKKYKKWR